MNDNSKRLETLIRTFAEEKNIPIVGLPNLNLNGLNQCAFAQMKDKNMYLVSHEEIDILQIYFNLSDNTVKKIDDFRKFSFNLYEKTNEKNHNRLKVILFNDNTVELSIIGGGLSSLMINLTKNDISVCLKEEYEKITKPLASFSDIDRTLSVILDLFKLEIIEKMGFDVTDVHLHDFMKFMNSSNEQILMDYFKDLPFNYISNIQLLESLSSDLGVDTTQLQVHKNNTQIPYQLSDSISHLVKKVIPRTDDNLKINQLINLMKFYYNLIGKEKNAFKIYFSSLTKSDLSLNSDFNRIYYSISLGAKLDIHIGYKLKHDNDFYTCVLDSEGPKDGTYYMFSSRILEDENLQPSQTFTDNIDYIYTTVLNDIKDHINNAINNIDEALTERHLELFKMVMI